MALLKVSLLFGVAILFILGSTVANDEAGDQPKRDQTVILGNISPFEKLIHSERIDVPEWWFTIKSREVSCPPHPSIPGTIISSIRVFDQLRTGENAYVNFTSGGIGKKYATVALVSKRGYPIRYLVEFYGR